MSKPLPPEFEGYLTDLAESMVTALVTTISLFGDAMPEVRAAQQRLGPHFGTALCELAMREARDVAMRYIVLRMSNMPTTSLVADAADRVLGGVSLTTLKDAEAMAAAEQQKVVGEA